MIRARRREHLEIVRERHSILADHPIIESPPHCDYQFRVVVPKTAFAKLMFDTVMSMTHRNAKAEAHRNIDSVGEEFVSAMHDVWGRMRRL